MCGRHGEGDRFTERLERAGKRSGEGAGVEVEEESGKGDVKRRRFAVNLR